MFRALLAPLLAILTLAGTATAVAADAAAGPGLTEPGPKSALADPEAVRRDVTLLFVLAFASVGGGVGLIAVARGAGPPGPNA
jgi:hypothetical protein